MPKNYKGHLLQIIISEKFLRNYVADMYLMDPLVDPIMNQRKHELLVFKKIPKYLVAELRNIADRMKKEGAGIKNKLSLLQLLAHFLDTYFTNFIRSTDQASVAVSDQNFKMQVKKLINQNKFEAFWGIEKYATLLHITPSTFKRQFEKHFHTTPLTYFKETQLKHAEKLLNTGKYSITEISYRLGYSSISNFSRSFKKYMGFAPSSKGNS